MNPLLSVHIALRALAGNMLRTGLTMLGVVIGVGAVVALISIGQGSQAQITAQIQGLGTNLLFVRPGAVSQQGVRTSTGQAPTLTLEDATAIAELPSVAQVSAEAGGFGQLVAGGQNWNTRILGVSQSYADVRNAQVAVGDWITQQQVDGRSSVVVLGSTVASRLFGESDPIDQTIRISMFGRTGTNFRVIGVTAPRGSSPLGDQDDLVFVPITTLLARLYAQRGAGGGVTVSTLDVQVVDEGQIDQAVAEIGDLLRQRHRVVEDDFTIQSQQDFLNTFSQILGTFTLLLGAIAGISLVVGGIGIMNIMLVSVTERTHEIGIRKAVGARQRDILVQFLTEALVVSVLGGAVGVALGSGVAALISTIPISGAGGATQTLKTLVSPESVVLAVGVAAAVGLFFGIYPAARAARLNPIDALRYE